MTRYSVSAVRNGKLSVVFKGPRPLTGFLVEDTETPLQRVPAPATDDELSFLLTSPKPEMVSLEYTKGGEVLIIPMKHVEKRADAFSSPVFYDIKSNIWTWEA